MMKYLFCCLALFSQAKISFSQTSQDTLLVVPAKNGLYFYHIVNKGETLYSLSREFRVDVKELAAFNKLTLQTPLKIYQLVKIPLNDKNLDQSAGVSSASGLKPLYHKVMKGETLYHIGQIHDKVPPAALKKWNQLTGNEVKTGQYLIVGWLHKEGEKNLAATPDNDPAIPAESEQKGTVQENEPSSPAEAAVKAPAASEKKNVPASDKAKATTASSDGDSFLNEVIASENENRGKKPAGHHIAPKAVNHTKKKAPGPVKTGKQPVHVAAEDDAFTVQAKPVATPPVKTAEKKPAPAVVKKEKAEKPDSFALMLNRVTDGPKKQAPAPEEPPSDPQGAEPAKPEAPASPVPAIDEADSSQLNVTVKSKFQALYDRQTDHNTDIDVKKGAAGWFRSNVKPGSGSYYALCDDLPRGTVVKVTNPINQRSVLVKVLDDIPKQKENYNLLIKLSDAAQGDLGVSQSRFWCEISYAKNEEKEK